MHRWIPLALALVSLTAVAQDDASVEARLREIFALRGTDDAGARDGFRALYEETGDIRALAQQGLAEAELGEHRDASEHLWQTLDVEHEWVERNREQLESVLGRSAARVARIDLSGPPGTRVSIGERTVSLPIGALAASPGAIHVVATYDDGATWNDTRNVGAGERWHIEVPVHETQPDEIDTPAPDPQPAEPRSAAPWVVLGAGGLVTVGGVVLAIVGNSLIQDVEGSDTGTLWADVRGDARRGETLSLVGFIGIGVGVAVLSAGLLWLLLADDGEVDDRRARWLGQFRF